MDSHGKPSMTSFLIKFLFRINRGINISFVCLGSRIVQEQLVVVNSDFTAVDSLCFWFYSKKCGCGVRTV